MISADWLCVGERLRKAADWNVSDPPACLTVGEGPRVQTALVLRGRVQLTWVPGHILLGGGVVEGFLQSLLRRDELWDVYGVLCLFSF